MSFFFIRLNLDILSFLIRKRKEACDTETLEEYAKCKIDLTRKSLRRIEIVNGDFETIVFALLRDF